MNIRLPEPPDGLSALHRTAHLEAPDGRRWFQANALTDDIPQHHPLVAQWLADQSRDHPGSLARGADRHAVLWTLSDALQDLDPAELAVEHVAVVIEFGPAWRLQPLVSEPVEDRFLDLGTIREVCIGVCSEVVRTWPEHILRKALLAAAASCVLAILPEGHAARPDVQRIYQQGAAHLP